MGCWVWVVRPERKFLGVGEGLQVTGNTVSWPIAWLMQRSNLAAGEKVVNETVVDEGFCVIRGCATLSLWHFTMGGVVSGILQMMGLGGKFEVNPNIVAETAIDVPIDVKATADVDVLIDILASITLALTLTAVLLCCCMCKCCNRMMCTNNCNKGVPLSEGTSDIIGIGQKEKGSWGFGLQLKNSSERRVQHGRKRVVLIAVICIIVVAIITTTVIVICLLSKLAAMNAAITAGLQSITVPTTTHITKSADPVAQLFVDAEQGDAEAQFRLGSLFLSGHGVAQSDEEAVKWYRKSAEQGNAAAQQYLEVMDDNRLGVAQSVEEGAKWHRKAEEGFRTEQ
uniref:Uncharacterized protein n=1 Tax=Plectus sambesii TaxID=2011161 RepID=A0A914W5U7_9BILA